MRYAQLNDKNICIAVSDLSGHVYLDNMIPIKEDENPILKKYNNGVWEDAPVNISISKEQKIEYSKIALSEWLDNNPLYYAPKKAFYTVTQEKQTQLTQMIALAQIAQQTGTPFTTTWNSTGGICEEWSLEELLQLTFAISSYVLPRVKKQQAYEVAINKCETQEELNKIEITYDTI